MENNTKEIMKALGEILGKDFSVVEDQLNQSPPGYFYGGGFGGGDKKEIETLKFDNMRLKKELDQASRFQEAKTRILLHEFYLRLYSQDQTIKTLLQSCSEVESSVFKSVRLEQESGIAIDHETFIQNLMEKIQDFELKLTLDKNQSTSLLLRSQISQESTQGTTPTPKKDMFLLESGDQSRTVKVLQFGQVQPQMSSQFPQQRKQNPQLQQPAANENISLPDISSTEIAPNKLSAPNKIININHVRGLQFYQKQLGKDGVTAAGLSQLDQLGGTSASNANINLQNNFAILARNSRSTSPTIATASRTNIQNAQRKD